MVVLDLIMIMMGRSEEGRRGDQQAHGLCERQRNERANARVGGCGSAEAPRSALSRRAAPGTDWRRLPLHLSFVGMFMPGPQDFGRDTHQSD